MTTVASAAPAPPGSRPAPRIPDRRLERDRGRHRHRGGDSRPGSVALLGFGIDSLRRVCVGFRADLAAARRAARDEDDEERIEHVERRAQTLVAASLVLLAAYIAWDSITSLLAEERPEPSPRRDPARDRLAVGHVVAGARRSGGWASRSGSRAMTADAFQTDACFWLSLFLLVGIGANALFGWWWADPLAAAGMTVFIGREALEAWRGDDDEESGRD